MNKSKKFDKKNIEDIAELTPMQEGMLFHYLNAPRADLYFEQLSIGISAPVDIYIFKQAWKVVTDTNEMLRTVFRWEELKNPYQVILKNHHLDFRYYDLTSKKYNKSKLTLKDIKTKDRDEKFDLREVPFRVTLCKIREEQFEIIISNHHILYDGWSNGILLKEFFDAYHRLVKGNQVIEPVRKTKFKRFVRWIRQQDTNQQELFWQSYLKGFTGKVGIPLKRRKRNEIKTTAYYQIKLPATLKSEMEGFVKRHHITIASFLYSVWGILLQRYHSNSDVLFYTTVSGRNSSLEGIENIVGLFINTLPLRVRTHPGENISEFLSRVYMMLQERREFENSSLMAVNESLDTYYGMNLFDSVVVIENYPLDIRRVLKPGHKSSTSTLTVNSFSYTGRTLYDLTVIITLFDEITLGFSYNSKLFDEELVVKIGDDILDTIHRFIINSREKVSRLTSLPQEVSQGILNRCNYDSRGPVARQVGELEKESPKRGGVSAPRDRVEKKLVDIWSRLFRVDKADIGIDTHFFDFGGHSLKASMLAARIHRELQVKMPLPEIFKYPTIRKLAQYTRTASRDRPDPIVPVEKKEHYPLSYAQKRFYLLQHKEKENTSYNGTQVMLLKGKLQVQHLEKTTWKLIERHESLRTSFIVVDGEPRQRVHAPGELSFAVLYHDSEEKSENPDTLIENFIKVFDLTRAPLLRVGLIRIRDQQHIFMIDVHHITADGTSASILIDDFMRLYRGTGLSPLKVRYIDFAGWQAIKKTPHSMKPQEEYWLKVFSGELPILNLYTDYPRAALPFDSYEGDTVYVTVEEETGKKLREIEKTSAVTLFMILTAAYNVLLMKYTGQEDIIVGTLVHGREHADLEKIIGVFTETLALRNHPLKTKTFKDFLQEVKENSLNAFKYADYPFEELLKKLQLKRDLNRSPLFDTLLLLQNYEYSHFAAEDPVTEPYQFRKNSLFFDLRLTVVEVGEGIRIEIEYARKLFKKETVERLAQHYVRVLTGVGDGLERDLQQLELLSPQEKQLLLSEFGTGADQPLPRESLCQLFRDQVLKSPDSTAVESGNAALSYRELNHRANRLAQLIRSAGSGTGHPAAILLDRSPGVVICIWAAWKARTVYIPIDTQYPFQRLMNILEDANATLLLSGTNHLDGEITRLYPGTIINLDRQRQYLEKEEGENLELEIEPGSPAYIIYTSGSTGKPKGAVVQHTGMLNHILVKVNDLQLRGDSVVAQNAPYTFDISIWQFFSALTVGGKTVIYPDELLLSPAEFIACLVRDRVTILELVPSYLSIILDTLERTRESFKKLEYLVVTGETVGLGLVKRWFERYPDIRMVNAYGPTEAADDITHHIMDKAPLSGQVPIGKPLANLNLYIMDEAMQLCPIGVKGELRVSGVGVGTGYLNNPELTAERFVEKVTDAGYRSINKKLLRGVQGGGFLEKSPPGRRRQNIYKTGDLARWSDDRTIEFLGRVDQQVKVRGFRIELEEIESRLLNHGRIKAAVVLVRDRAANDKYLCAYYTSEQELDLVELRQYLSVDLPDYMIPSYFVRVEKMPLTANGKVNRKALPAPDPGTVVPASQGNQWEEAGSENEIRLVKIWQKVMQVEKIGIEDNFFELGGDSLMVIRVVAAVREQFGVEVPVKTFFLRPDIKSLSKEIEHRSRDTISIPPAPSGVNIPLSFAQERLWFLRQLDQENVAYHVPRAIHLKGVLDVTLLERTFTEIIRRHEILRTTFPCIDGEPVQHIRAPYPFKIPVIDISHQGREQEGRIREYLLTEGQRPFDLEKGPMIRLTLLKLKPGQHLLVSTEHHLVHDGWTQGVLIKELVAIFTAFSRGEPSPLPELPIQYKDFAYWQRNYMQGEVLEKHLAYWKEKLSGLEPVLSLPLDRPRPPVISGRGALRCLFISEELSRAMALFNQEQGVTLFMTMLTVFKVLLYRYTGSGDLCVGSGMANRRFKEMEGMLGMVINTLVLRTQISGRLSFFQCLQQVKTTCLEAYQHEDTPFGKVVEALRPERSLSYMPLVQVMFGFMDTPTGSLTLPGLELRIEDVHNRSAKFDIDIIVVPPSDLHREEYGEQIEVTCQFNTDIFNHETVERMLKHYERLLKEVIVFKKGNQQISTLTMMEESELAQLLYDFNKTQTRYPAGKTLHQLFAEQVEQTPDHVALVGQIPNKKGPCGRILNAFGDNVSLTYKELNLKSRRMAHLLRERGVHANTIVGIMVGRSPATIVGLLGILKAGGAYLPIDPNYPRDRIDYMLADSSANVLVTTRTLAEEGEKVRRWEGGKIFLDDPLFAPAFAPSASTLTSTCRVGPDNLAYIIYTSGTTGKPKGVLVEHRNVVRLLFNDQFQFDFNDKDIWTLFHSCCFDFSVWEMYGSLLYGGKLLVVSKAVSRDPRAYRELLEKSNVTVLNQTPSAFYHLVKEETKKMHPKLNVKVVVLGGEALKPLQLKKWKERYPAAKLINMYGITETTVHVTYKEITEIEIEDNISNIGTPIPTLSTYIMDNHLSLVPMGVPGELVVGGKGVARGYLNRPALTAEKFIIDPYRSAGKLYRSGDMVRLIDKETGDMEYLGRMDSQVKIRGHRIELGEIRCQLLKHENIKEALVIPIQATASQQKGNEPDGSYLCAYIAANKECTVTQLREWLSRQLPAYMIPGYFVQLDEIPLTANGKPDTKALPGPDSIRPQLAVDYVVPGNRVEKIIARVWQEVLQLDRVGIYDNFFDLGGHSMNITLVNTKLKETLGRDIPLVAMFRYPTIHALEQYLTREAPTDKRHQEEIHRFNEMDKGKLRLKQTLKKRKENE